MFSGGEFVQNPFINNKIKEIQTKSERYYSDIRSQSFEYNKVTATYINFLQKARKQVFEGNYENIILKMATEVSNNIVHEAKKTGDFESSTAGILESIEQSFGGLLEKITEEELLQLGSFENLSEFLKEEIINKYHSKLEQKLYNNPESEVNLQQVKIEFLLLKFDSFIRDITKGFDKLREVIGLRGYAQKDPLIEFKLEGMKIFEELLFKFKKDTVADFMKKL
jgi:preprotein translocase subunit SecA